MSEQPANFRLPASSANLGAAFDSAALAISLHLEVSASLSNRLTTIVANGRDAELCCHTRDSLILEVYRRVLEKANRPTRPLTLKLQNEIPIGKGFGSSAAARLAGILLANHFGDLNWPESRILREANLLEGHSDNVGACWLGGLALVRTGAGEVAANPFRPAAEDTVNENGEAEQRPVRLDPKEDWPLLFAVPATALPTEQARGALPEQYSRGDVVANLQSAVLLVAAFCNGQSDLFSYAFRDRLHQPYRAALCPLLTALQPLAGEGGVLGVALSGAGPSVLMILDREAPLDAVEARVTQQLRRFQLTAELLPARIELEGARTSWVADGRNSKRPALINGARQSAGSKALRGARARRSPARPGGRGPSEK
jgi:homoserine kinase